MKESAQAAMSLLKTRAHSVGIDADLFARSDLHVHVPADAAPKHGPSAGVAMFVALSSLMTGRAVPLPARNRRDYDDIPPGARDRLRFVWLETVDDALAASIGAATAELASLGSETERAGTG